jgi:hypothetical protein
MNQLKQDLIAARKFIEKPENWTTEVMARDKDGKWCQLDSENASCFCSLGALEKVASGANSSDYACDRFRDMRNALVSVIKQNYPMAATFSVARFNDEHQHQEVLALFDQAIESCE